MGSKLKLLFLFILCAALSSTAFGGRLEKKTFKAKSYSGSRDRLYQIYIPNNAGNAVPMVMVLHGCNQTEQNMIDETRFNDLAEKDNFIVVYPSITSYDGMRNPNCWGFWFDQHIHEGKGEVEDLYQIAKEVEAMYDIDENRRYITGLSSGGAMSAVMAVAQSEYFAAAGAAAGLPYSETSSSVGSTCYNPGTFKSVSDVVSAMKAEQRSPEEKRTIPFMTIHSNHDCTVNKKASEKIRDSWIEHYGADTNAYEETDCTKEGVGCTHAKYGKTGRSVVETVFYSGQSGLSGTHYWVGDNDGQYANSKGPSAAELFWDFFKRHPFSENHAPVVAIIKSQRNGPDIEVSGTVTDEDPGDSIASLKIKFIGDDNNDLIAETDITSSLSGNGSFSHEVRWPSNDTLYIPVFTVTDSRGESSSYAGPHIPVGNPRVPPSVTVKNIIVDGQCVDISGTSQQGSSALSSVQVKVGSGDFENATGTLNWKYKKCSLSYGRHTLTAKATDINGMSASNTFDINIPSPCLEETGSTLAHISRYALYKTGWGLCDRSFTDLFNKYGISGTFTIYGTMDERVWCADKKNLPSD